MSKEDRKGKLVVFVFLQLQPCFEDKFLSIIKVSFRFSLLIVNLYPKCATLTLIDTENKNLRGYIWLTGSYAAARRLPFQASVFTYLSFKIDSRDLMSSSTFVPASLKKLTTEIFKIKKLEIYFAIFLSDSCKIRVFGPFKSSGLFHF